MEIKLFQEMHSDILVIIIILVLVLVSCYIVPDVVVII